MKTKLTKFGWLLSTMLILLFTASCNKSKDDPMPGEGVMGDWITLAGTDYYNIQFTSVYTYSMRSAMNDVIETGSYMVDTQNKTIALKPNLDGASVRYWKYTYVNSDELTVTGRIFNTDTAEKKLTLTRQLEYEEKTVTVHSTADKSELKAEMLLGSTRIKLVGEINKDDFKVLRDFEPMEELNMSAVKVVGTIIIMTDSEGNEITVEGNAIPEEAFGMITDPETEANTTLKKIVLPTSVEIIGFRAFQGCNIGGVLEIPVKTTTIMMQAFSSCNQLTGVKFPAEMAKMDMAVFEFCTNLSGTINFPKGLEGVSAGMFRGCSKITEIVLPDDVTAIGEYALIGCSKLKSINIPASLEQVYSYGLTNCAALSGSLTLPEGMRVILDYGFAGTGYNGTLTIPVSMEEMGKGAFEGSKFSSIVFKWKADEGEPTFNDFDTWFPDEFKVGKGNKTIKIPKGQLEWYTGNMPAPTTGCIYNLEEQK